MESKIKMEFPTKMENGSVTSIKESVKLYKYRWVILGLFCLYAAISYFQFLQYSIITNIAMKYYEVEAVLVDLSSLIFSISYIVCFIPVGFLIERYNLKVTAMLGSGLTAVGSLLKLASISRDRFPVVMVSQLLCGIAQVFILSVPSKVASTWFGTDEVSTACAIALFGTQIGLAIGCITSPGVVRNSDNPDIIGDDLNTLIIYNAAITCGIFLLVVIFFRARPMLPPSQSQLSIAESKTETQSTFRILKTMLSNKNYLLLLGIYGVANGVWIAFGIFFNILYLGYFPNSDSEVGWVAASGVIVGGCIGCIIFGYLLDKTHKFKLIGFVAIFGAAVMLIVQTIVFEYRVKEATFAIFPIFGFFIASILVVSFEYATEVTYPLPEAISCGVLNAVIYIFSIVITLVAEELFVDIGYLWTLVIIIVLLFLCSIGSLFVVPDLRRREENMKTSKADSLDSVAVKAVDITRL